MGVLRVPIKGAAMRIEDLGELAGPVLLYGGPYSNLQATRAFFDEADRLGVPEKHRICTGDVVAYGADAAACCDMVRARGGAVLAGNCERQLAAGASDCGCGFDAGSACDLLSRGWYPHAAAQTGEAARTWMAGLPDLLVFQHGAMRWAVIHGGLTDVSRFIWPSDPDEVFREEIDAIEAAVGPVEGVVAGHCGVAFTRIVGNVTWLNAGVIGMPPHDGRPETRFALLAGGQSVIHRLRYDASAARGAMQAAGLVQGYDRALTTGRWPSEKSLPLQMRSVHSFASG
jgi:predicted phosphodiesterase